MHNITKSTYKKTCSLLHLKAGHPIEILKNRIYNFMDLAALPKYDNFNPYVGVDVENTNSPIIYYHDTETILRPNMIVHIDEIFEDQFLMSGPIFNKCAISKTTYNVLHQTIGILNNDNDSYQLTLINLCKMLFPHCDITIDDLIDDFIDNNENKNGRNKNENSIETYMQNMHKIHVKKSYHNTWNDFVTYGKYKNKHNKVIFEISLDAVCMYLYNIPDIRMLWSNYQWVDMITQQRLSLTKYNPNMYTVLPYLDLSLTISVPINEIIIDCENKCKWIYELNFLDVLRDLAGDRLESVMLKNNEVNEVNADIYNLTYNLHYSQYEPTGLNHNLFNSLILFLHDKICKEIKDKSFAM